MNKITLVGTIVREIRNKSFIFKIDRGNDSIDNIKISMPENVYSVFKKIKTKNVIITGQLIIKKYRTIYKNEIIVNEFSYLQLI